MRRYEVADEQLIDFPPLRDPPPRPPDVCLIGSDVSGVWQRGIMSHADWTVDGRRAVLGDKSDGWPDAIDSTPEGTARVRFLTESAPTYAEVCHFDRPNLSEPLSEYMLSTIRWRNPRAGRVSVDRYVESMHYGWDPDPPGWDLYFPIPPYTAVSFINVYATWLNLVFPSDSYSANWKVVVRRTQLASRGPTRFLSNKRQV